MEHPLGAFLGVRLVGHHHEIAPGSGSAVCVPPGNGGDQLMCGQQLGIGADR